MRRILVEAPCRPTESASKVKMAILNIFPDAHLEEGGLISGRAQSLERFGELLRNQRIRNSAREVLMGSIRGSRMVFHLNKQAAFVGKVSFSAHSPLGYITVTIEAEDVEAVVEEVAPRILGNP
ncbi:MAG: RNA-binding domain-containing protein [Thermoplasmata archaeon]